MAQHPSGAPVEIDAAILQHLLEQDRALLIDVREREEFESERIPAAVLMPLSSFDARAVAAMAPERQLVVLCLSGRRAQQAAQAVMAHGRPVLILKNGLLGWKEAGLPIEPRADGS
ncbi:MAG TPA: rhodanese-like domain-containing protein [Bacillota bacterium]